MRSFGIARASFVLTLLIPGVATADEFSDFRIPPNRALLWTGDFNTGASGHVSDQNLAESSTGHGSATLATNIFWFSDSDPAFTRLSASAGVLGDRSHGTSRSGAPLGSF